MPFELEQEDFSVEAAPEARERSVRADDAVAGNGDAEGIAPTACATARNAVGLPIRRAMSP